MFGPSDRPTKFRETFLAYFAGILFACGWWVWIDGAAYSKSTNDTSEVVFGHFVPGMVSTLALIMINSVNWSDVEGMGMYSMDDSSQKRIRIWLLLSGVVAFGSIFAAVWIAVAHWFTNEKQPLSNWPGAALILQNVLIFLSGITYRYAKPPPGDEYNAF